MAAPMKTFITDDGRKQRPPMIESPWEPCDCLNQMGNDFYFLPTGSCLRKDKTCNSPQT